MSIGQDLAALLGAIAVGIITVVMFIGARRYRQIFATALGLCAGLGHRLNRYRSGAVRTLALLAGIMTCPAALAAQSAPVEVDHVFVFATPGGEPEAQAMRKLGFVVDTFVSRHTGQGTASRSVYFDNAYFELIWIDSTVSVTESLRSAHEELRRAAEWRAIGANPFGIGLRRNGSMDSLGVPFTRYTADWMRPGTFIALLREPAELNAFDMFVVPEYMAVPAWIGKLRRDMPHVLAHPNGARRITSVELRAPLTHHPKAAQTIRPVSFRVVRSEEPLLVLEIDDAKHREERDLRPLLPVLIRR